MNIQCVIVVLSLFAGALRGAAELSESVTSIRSPKDNEEVARLFSEDQGDRSGTDPYSMEYGKVATRDFVRRKRVMELYSGGALTTGRDYYHSGMILQHGNEPEDYLLCHELCVAAVFLSSGSSTEGWLPKAKWLAAASEDRFLLSIWSSATLWHTVHVEWRLFPMASR